MSAAGLERFSPERRLGGAIGAEAVSRRRVAVGIEQPRERQLRVIRDADLLRIFRPGRELVFPCRGEDGAAGVSTRVLTPAQANAAKALIGVVKVMVGLEPSKVIKDSVLSRRLGGPGAGWSLSTVRRTRRICAAAGVDVRPVLSRGAPGIVAAEFTGCCWSLDRRRVPILLQEVSSGLTIGVVSSDHTLKDRAHVNALQQAEELLAKGARASGQGPPGLVQGLDDEADGQSEAGAVAADRDAEPLHAEPPPRAPLEEPRDRGQAALAALAEWFERAQRRAGLGRGSPPDLAVGERLLAAAGFTPLEVALARARLSSRTHAGPSVDADPPDGGERVVNGAVNDSPRRAQESG